MYKILDSSLLSKDKQNYTLNSCISLLQISGLTYRQSEVLISLRNGLSNKDLAEKLNVSENTVKVHISAIFKIFDVHNRTEAVLEMQRILSKTN
ncbi:MAG: response regulator transcription factor [Thiohalomonadales bacterium]